MVEGVGGVGGGGKSERRRKGVRGGGKGERGWKGVGRGGREWENV